MQTEIEYLYLKDKEGIVEIHLNTENQYKIIESKLYVNKNDDYIDNLFGENIKNIIAIVGENGAGKTTYLKKIINFLEYKGDVEALYFLVLRKKEKLFHFSNMNIDSSLPKGSGTLKSSLKNFQLLFYSNVFDTNNFMGNTIDFKDISTNQMLLKYSNQGKNIKHYKTREMKKHITFTVNHRKDLELDEYVKIPERIVLKTNPSLLDESLEANRNFMSLKNEISLLMMNELDKSPKEIKKNDIYSTVSKFVHNQFIDWIYNFIDDLGNLTTLKYNKKLFEDFFVKLKLELELELVNKKYEKFFLNEGDLNLLFSIIDNEFNSKMNNEIIYDQENIYQELIKDIISEIGKELHDTILIEQEMLNIVKEQTNKLYKQILNTDKNIYATNETLSKIETIKNEVKIDSQIIKKNFNDWKPELKKAESFFEKLVLKFEEELGNNTTLLNELNSNKIIGENLEINFEEKSNLDIDSKYKAKELRNRINFKKFKDFEYYNKFDEDDLLLNLEEINVDENNELIQILAQEFETMENEYFKNQNDTDNYGKETELNNENIIDIVKLKSIDDALDILNVHKHYYLAILDDLALLLNKSYIYKEEVVIESENPILKEYIKKYKDSKKDMLIDFEWRNLSSGEYSFLSFLSRFFDVYSTCKENLLVVIDEGELYFHPQWQKKYIQMLIRAFNNIFPNTKLQILLTTHSPFIVSDLPHYNIKMLKKNEEGFQDPYSALNLKNTFGANIQELFANRFFLQDGLTGEFSKNKINEKINRIFKIPNTALLEYEEFKRFFSIIGEPIVKKKTLNLLDESVKKYFEINKIEEEEIHLSKVDKEIIAMEKKLYELRMMRNQTD